LIVTKAPLRISLFGGGTDIPMFYEKEPGAVLGFAISKYVYIFLNKKFSPGIRLSYSITENVEHASELKHDIARECLKLTQIDSGVEIVSIGDMPHGTGLGSSSAFTVALLRALHAYKGEELSVRQLAEEACHIEIDILHKPIGKQDQYFAVLGGKRYITFTGYEVEAENIKHIFPDQYSLRNHSLLLYLGNQRSADDILKEQCKNMEQQDYFLTMRSIRDIARTMRDKLSDTFGDEECDYEVIGEYLSKSWAFKSSMAESISNPYIDSVYKEVVLKGGAYGAKLLGAGGSGFLYVICDPEDKDDILKRVPECKNIDYLIDWKGCTMRSTI
jgi:D-glycero-alpha-D-manno-heptose-7-phosphate kinase